MDINFKNGSKIVVSDIVVGPSKLDSVYGVSVINSLSHYPSQLDISDMLKFFGMDADKMVKCPECNMKCQLVHMFPHLNDRGETYSASYSTGWGKGTIKGVLKQDNVKCFKNHKWSFKQIGKWLESIGY